MVTAPVWTISKASRAATSSAVNWVATCFVHLRMDLGTQMVCQSFKRAEGWQINGRLAQSLDCPVDQIRRITHRPRAAEDLRQAGDSVPGIILAAASVSRVRRSSRLYRNSSAAEAGPCDTKACPGFRPCYNAETRNHLETQPRKSQANSP